MGDEKVFRVVKSKFMMKITELEEVEAKDENGETTKELKVINSKWIPMRGKEFSESMKEDYDRGIKHQITIVKDEPDKFQFNHIYIHALGKKAWTYIKKED
jgi:hypothetical protein